MGTPVHDALAAVDHLVVVPVHEDLADGLGVLRAHRELLVVEVHRAAHALDLLDDDAAVLLLPLLAGLEELLAADGAAVDALLLELFVDLGLGGDAGVVRAHDPAGAVAAHAGIADVGVLDGVIEGVAHVEHAGDVGGRDDDGAVALAGLALAALVVAALEPLVEHALLGRPGLVGLGHLLCHVNLPLGAG